MRNTPSTMDEPDHHRPSHRRHQGMTMTRERERERRQRYEHVCMYVCLLACLLGSGFNSPYRHNKDKDKDDNSNRRGYMLKIGLFTDTTGTTRNELGAPPRQPSHMGGSHFHSGHVLF